MRKPYRDTADGVMLWVRLQPGARQTALGGLREDAAGQVWWEIKVTAPPEDGKANAALIKLLAKTLRQPKRAIEIVTGQSAREKTLRVQGDIKDIQTIATAFFAEQPVSE
ncbi:DUF167 domain-containing protein [Limibacillus sp. MBR-115]|uniref:DUF167 domain-containing protein n=1 Tax=Limibacillus sp. MBR-115 TaxID=3156465 RepID=UPI0033954964